MEEALGLCVVANKRKRKERSGDEQRDSPWWSKYRGRSLRFVSESDLVSMVHTGFTKFYPRIFFRT